MNPLSCKYFLSFLVQLLNSIRCENNFFTAISEICWHWECVQVIIIKGLVIPVNVIKPISELVVYCLLDGAHEVPASALERADGIVHRFGLGAQMKTGSH